MSKSMIKTGWAPLFFLVILVILVIIELVAIALIGQAIYSGKYDKTTHQYNIKISKTGIKFVSVMSAVLLLTSIGSLIYYILTSNKLFNSYIEHPRSMFHSGQLIVSLAVTQLIGSLLLFTILKDPIDNKDGTYGFGISEIDVVILKVSFPIIVAAFVGSSIYVGSLLIIMEESPPKLEQKQKSGKIPPPPPPPLSLPLAHRKGIQGLPLPPKIEGYSRPPPLDRSLGRGLFGIPIE